MKRILKNFGGSVLQIHGFRGRDLSIKPKSSKVFDLDLEEERAEYQTWQLRYGNGSGDNPFLGDITSRFPALNNPAEIMDAETRNMVEKLEKLGKDITVFMEPKLE